MRWSVEDELGKNPIGIAGEFEFDIDFTYDAGDPGVMYDSNGDGYPGHAPSVEPESVICTSVRFEGDDVGRRPTAAEQQMLSKWFWVWLDANPDDCRSICESGMAQLVDE